MNKQFLLNVVLFDCDSSSPQEEFPGKLKGFSAATLQPLFAL